MIAVVDLDDAVHPLEVEHHAAGIGGRRAAAAEVLTRRDRVERNAALVGDADHRLHLLGRAGRHGSRRAAVLGQTSQRGIGVAVMRHVLVGREDPVLADHAGELLQCRGEDRGRNIGWCSHVRQAMSHETRG